MCNKRKENLKQYYEANKDKIKASRKKHYELNKEIINEKKRKKYKENNEYKKIYYQNNSEIIKEKKKTEYHNNLTKYREKAKVTREQNSEYMKKYYLEHKDIMNKNNAEYIRKRKSVDIIFHLKCNIKALISLSIKRNGFTKRSKTFEILGCTYEEFKQHLESQFEDWMTWDNYGKYNGQLNYGWDIDHIIPLNIAKDEKGIVALNHYTNLKPLCSKVNRDIKRSNF